MAVSDGGVNQASYVGPLVLKLFKAKVAKVLMVIVLLLLITGSGQLSTTNG